MTGIKNELKEFKNYVVALTERIEAIKIKKTNPINHKKTDWPIVLRVHWAQTPITLCHYDFPSSLTHDEILSSNK